MLFMFSAPVLIRHLWQLKTVVFLHWCLIHVVLLVVAIAIELLNRQIHGLVKVAVILVEFSISHKVANNSTTTNTKAREKNIICTDLNILEIFFMNF